MKNYKFKWLLLSFILSIASITQVNADTRRIYCKMTHSWWTSGDASGDASIGCYAWNNSENSEWPGTKMTPTGTAGEWYFDLDTKYTKVVFTRLNSAGDTYWGAKTNDVTLDANNYYTIDKNTACWSDNSCTCNFTASKYAPTPAIEGSMNSWKPDVNVFSGTSGSVTCSITLSANTVYELKVRTGANLYGYGSNTGDLTYFGQSGSTALSTSGSNIRLATAGAGTYVFTWDCTSHTLSVAYPTVTHPSSDYVYFKNTGNWTKVKAHVFTGGTSIDNWPGMEISSFSFDGTNYYYAALGDKTSIIFSKSGDASTKTGDLTTASSNKGKYYDYSSSSWKDFTATLTLNHQGPTNDPEPDAITVTYNANTNLTGDVLTTDPQKDGYNFGGYYLGVGGGNSCLINASGNVQNVGGYTSSGKWIRTSSATVYAKWTQSVTLNRNGASTGSTSANVTYNSAAVSAIDNPTMDNYTFQGWYPNSDGTGSQVINTSGVLQGPVTDWTGVAGVWQHAGASTLYAKWTSTITLDKNGGSADGSVTVTYNGSAGTPSAPTYAGKVLMGYYAADDGDNKIMDKDGTLHANKPGYTDEDGNWIGDGDAVLYAHWTDHTWALYYDTRTKKLGDLISRGSDVYTLNCNIVNGTNNANWSFLMDGETIYHYGAENPIGYDRTLSSGEGQLNWQGDAYGWYTIKVFKDITTWKYRADASPEISFTASPTGGTVTATAALESTISSGAHITYNTEVDFSASAGTGYTFEGWYGASDFSGGRLSTDNPLEVTSITSATGRYAKFTEDLVTLTANDGDHGTVSASIDEIGISTSSTITATPATHYHVASWETSSNVVTVSGGGATSSITVRTDGTGDAATVTPIYAEDNSSFELMERGSSDDDNDSWGYLGAATLSITLSDLPENTTYKIYIKNGDDYWRNSGGKITVNNGKSSLIYKYGSNNKTHYIEFTTSVAGDYKLTFEHGDSEGTLSATYPVEPTYSATVSLKDGTTPGCSVSPKGSITLRQYEYTTITATAEPGFRFKQWNTSGCAFANSTTSTDATASFTATANGATIEAEFTNDGFIYFDNTMSKWGGDIYVYFFNTSNWWYNDKNDGKGPGVVANQNVHYHKMDQIPGTQIYYYDYHVANPATNAICFTSGDHHSSSGLWKTSAAWRSDYNSCLPCYIASEGASQWKNETGYHNAGYWKRWGNTYSGFTLYYDDGINPEQHIDFTNSDPYSSIYNAEITLSSANTVYGYNVARCNGGKKLRRKDYSGDIQDSDSDYPRELAESDYNGGMRTSAAGTYKFQLSLASDHIMLTVEYPLSVGDYRVRLVNDTKNHASGRIVRARAEERTDTISFFIDHTKSASNVLYVDSCTSTGNPPGWNRISDVDEATLALSSGTYSTKTGVYKFGLKHTKNKDVELVLLEEPVYDGAYYVRTDGLDGKWTAYMTTPDNKMQYSKKSLETKANYDYYVPKWIDSGTNVQFTVANDYSPCISDTLYGDAQTGGADIAHQTLPADANVRFMWNSGTNEISRAYLDGATTVGSHFLELHTVSTGKIFNEKDVAITDTIFEDTKNWIYQVDVKALPGATARLTAEYNGNTQHLIDGGEDAQQLIGGDEEDPTKYNLRMVYDFKTNILISAWIAETDQNLTTTTMALDADLMIVRYLQDAAAQLTFTTGSISNIKTIYGALRFKYDDMVGQMDNWYASNIYKKLIYDVSFPFDVNVKDIFGVGNMGDHWVIQKYNGAKRAKEGMFLGDDDTYWEDLTADSVMHAYEGYTVFIDRPSFNSAESVIWKNKESGGSVYLYFPSASVDDKTISRGSTTLHLDSLNCKIDRTWNDPETPGTVWNHKFTDSNWRMIGTPLLSDTTGNFSSQFKAEVNYDAINPFGYLYEWNYIDNSYRIASTTSFTFKTMHGYMVQFAGDITFKGTYIHKAPNRIVAAEPTNDNTNHLIELQMTNENENMVHTYVELRNNACDTFALNEDVYMIRSSSMADLYTYAGSYDVAANVLSVNNHIVPIGMNVKKAATYTFSMPNDFRGTVTLVDTYTGTRTNLALSDYTVNLPKGVNNERFLLEININQAPTAIDGVEDGSGSLKDGKAHKFIENGVMYILKNGNLYDARGNRVR